MRKFLVGLACLMFVGSALAQAKTINIAWDDTQAGVRYRVYHKVSTTAAYIKDCAAAATNNCRDAGTVKTFAWTGAGLGTHYFVVSAYAPDPANPTVELESGYSPETSSTVVPSPPTAIRVVSQTASVQRKSATLVVTTNIPTGATLQVALGGTYWYDVAVPAAIATTHAGVVVNTRPHAYYKYRWTFTGDEGQTLVSEGEFTTL